jgi:nucleotide-binding universal stress UspA family protein
MLLCVVSGSSQGGCRPALYPVPVAAHHGEVSEFATSILVATDLSEGSYAGLAEAARICRATGCTARLLYVFDVSALALPKARVCSESTLRRIAEEATGAAFSVLLGLKERFFQGVNGVEICTLEHPGAALGVCAAARRFGADLIVLSTAGMRGQKESGVGSVTTRVLAAAPCRVLVVPSQGASDFAH